MTTRQEGFDMKTDFQRDTCEKIGMPESNDSPHPPQIDREAFRARVAWVQCRSGLNKVEFAASIGLSKSNYRQVELGSRLLTVGQIYTLYMTHGVPMEYLLTGQQSGLPDKFKP
jgi:hypothetical protein